MTEETRRGRTKATKIPPIEVRESAIQGRGVHSSRPIRKGSWIVEYTGERITHAEADLRYDERHMDRHHTFLFTLDQDTCIDAAVGGNEARFINHSCDPNCETVYASAEGEIWIVSMRDIAPGEELTYDYGYTLDDESVEEALRRYPCFCRTEKCRGTILNLG
jgi:hypothetical protein